jgi:hypothetical protein
MPDAVESADMCTLTSLVGYGVLSFFPRSKLDPPVSSRRQNAIRRKSRSMRPSRKSCDLHREDAHSRLLRRERHSRARVGHVVAGLSRSLPWFPFLVSNPVGIGPRTQPAAANGQSINETSRDRRVGSLLPKKSSVCPTSRASATIGSTSLLFLATNRFACPATAAEHRHDRMSPS